jgi:hypothetical protein
VAVCFAESFAPYFRRKIGANQAYGVSRDLRAGEMQWPE